MCIICNLGVDQETSMIASKFVDDFASSRAAMSRAKASMLACVSIAPDATTRRRYDKAHKAMARILREWNAIEELRERVEPTSTGN